MESDRLAKRPRLHEPTANDQAGPVPQASSSWQEHHHGSSHLGGIGLQHQNAHIHVNSDLIIGKSATLNDTHDHRKLLLESLAFEQIDSRQASIKKAFRNTCRWFLQTPVYKEWEDKDPSQDENHFLWIKGKPGAGKSTLMKFLYQHLQPKSKRTNHVLISFFFNARGHGLEKSTVGLYRSLLVQLLEKQPDLLDTLNIPRRDRDWDIDSLKSLFEQAIEALEQTPVICLVDALDECDEMEARENGLSIILEDQDKHQEDIATYLGKALRIGHDDLANEIRLDLQEKASGVFMWVVLVVDILNKEFDAGRKHTLKDKVRQLPANLHELFLDILTRDSNHQGALLLCIQWVLFAKRPLAPKELYFAILSGYEPERLEICHSGNVSDEDIYKYILNNSKGVVESTKGKTSTIQFIHESVRDFLLKEDGLDQIFPVLEGNIHGQSQDTLKRCCIAYIDVGTKVASELQKPTAEVAKSRLPFLEYAIYGILHHAEQAESNNVSQSEFLVKFPRREWIKHRNVLEKHKSRHYTPNASLSYILAEFDTPALIRAQPYRRPFFDVEDERYGLPILAAMATKSSAAVQTMLEIEAEQAARVSWFYFQSLIPTPHDGFFNSPTRDFYFSRRRKIITQMLTHNCEALILFLLLAEDIDIKSKDETGRTLLEIAGGEGYHVLFAEILKIQPGILTADSLNQLLFQATNGAAAKMLLERGAVPLAVNAKGRTPLHEHIRNTRMKKWLEVISVLINTGVGLSVIDSEGWTPLLFACKLTKPGYHGHEKAAAASATSAALLLIEAGADISIADKEGKTPLHHAFFNGAAEVTKQLIDHGADISSVGNEGKTLLHHASSSSYYGALAVVKKLTEHGADISAVDNEGKTPLHYAASISASLSSYEASEVVKQLIDHGAAISIADNEGKTPLHYACSSYKASEVVKRLIEHGADVSIVDNAGKTPLHRTAEYHLQSGTDQLEIAKQLIEHGADVLIKDKVGKSPLDYAPRLYDRELVKLLQESCQGGVITVSKNGKTTMDRALLHGNVKRSEQSSSFIKAEQDPNVTQIHTEFGSESHEKDECTPQSSYELLSSPQCRSHCLKREISLSPAEPNIIESIRRHIVESLHSNSKFHQRAPPPVHVITFEVNWDINLFLEQQNYGCQLAEALPTVIALTGTPTDAMATTVHEYMKKTWPMTGKTTLKLIQDVLSQERDRQYCATLFDGTELRAFPDVEDSKTLRITMTGTVTSIAEVAEQLSWLGSALSWSQQPGLHACVAQIRRTHSQAGAKQSFVLDFDISKVEVTEKADGQCWHDLFNTPMLATGFPIPYRDKSNTGIEMPLDLMASLVGSDKIDYFEQKALIKGFSALLTPNYRSNDTLFWHLSVNKSGGRISYPIGSTLGIVGITYNDIKDLRHVVGWCGSARFNAGLKGASYEVVGSTFPELHCHPASANASIHQGDQVQCSLSFKHGVRDKSIHCAADTYLEKLKWIKEQLVVLWDEEDKRGWLVNGASALLHLVRASLRYESIDRDEGRNLLFQDGHIQEEEYYWAGATAAYHVLRCSKNREISLYDVRDARTLEERIIKHYRHLETAFDLQESLLQYETRQALSQSAEQSLQFWAAWDFAGLAKYSGPFSPKLATIQAGHLDWLDFLRENSGITLIGNGFGEIIEPDSDSFCKDWSQLPKEKYYLAASRLDIKMVTDKHPERKYVFKDVGGGLVPCRCPDEGRHNCLNPLQPHLSPHSPESPTTKSGLEKLRGDGAIIFDQSTILVSGKDTAPQVGAWNKSNIEHAATSNRKRKAERDLQDSAKKQNLHTPTHSDYRVAIICPLAVEIAAVRCMFDDEVPWQSSNALKIPDDPNDYILGKIGGHHVVLTWLRGKRQGKSAAAGVASDLQRTFQHIQWCFLVGIGGGNPSSKHDIHLGDVVVAEPDKRHCGVVQYDLGKDTDNGFELKGSLDPPPDEVRNALFRMQVDHFTQKGNKIDEIVRTMIAKDTEGLAQYMRPDPEMDILFDHGSKHEPDQDTCLSCDLKQIVSRPHRTQSKIHYGLIASGDNVMKSAERRGIQSRNAGSDVLCFEMEAAGVLTVLPCTVIRGISDYADSHKNNKWQAYAAAAAAAFTRMLLIDYLIP